VSQRFSPSEEEKEMNEKSVIPLVFDSEFPVLVGWLAFALVPIVSWAINA
jgi:hypothetical protein